MRVAYFTESLPPIIDGVTHTLCQLIHTLEEEKVDYRFYSPIKPESPINWRDKVSRVNSVPFPLYRYYRLGLPYFHGLESELDAFAPDLIHVVNPTLLGIYGVQYAKRRTISVVSSYHTHFVSYFSYYGFSAFEKWGWNYLQWFYNQSHCTFAPSPSTVHELENRGIKNVSLWQRGIDLEKFSPCYRSDELRNSIDAADIPILLYVGRLVKEKDLDDLVGAVTFLKEWGHRFKLVLVGDGPMRQDLQQRLPEAYFAGYRQGADLARWYASADIFVFPSTTETFGNVILEAFASGLPVAAVNQGGAADLVRSGVNGLLFKSHSSEDFAHTVQVLINDADYRKLLGEQAISAAGKFSWREINKELLDRYHKVIHEGTVYE